MRQRSWALPNVLFITQGSGPWSAQNLLVYLFFWLHNFTYLKLKVIFLSNLDVGFILLTVCVYHQIGSGTHPPSACPVGDNTDPCTNHYDWSWNSSLWRWQETQGMRRWPLSQILMKNSWVLRIPKAYDWWTFIKGSGKWWLPVSPHSRLWTLGGRNSHRTLGS